MSNPPLFREAARQALKVRLEGEVVAFTPPSLRALAFVFIASAVLLAAFAASASYTRYVPASGTLAPLAGLVTVAAPLKGDILRIDVQQGQRVAAGQALALLRNTQVQADGADALERQRALLASRKDLSAELRRAREAEIDQAVAGAQVRAEGTRRALAAAQDTLAGARLQVEVSRRYLGQQRELVKSGFMASAGLAPAERSYLADQQQVRQAEQGVASLALELANAEQAILAARGQKAALAAQSADSAVSLDLEAARLSSSAEAVISSTVAGTVAAVPALRGPVAAGAPLFVIAPAGPVYAHLLLSEAAAHKAKPGQAVSLRVAARAGADGLRLNGTVESLALAPVPAGRDGEPGYLARVKLDAASQQSSFPLGARVEARFQVETRSLLGWLFEPLLRGLRQAGW